MPAPAAKLDQIWGQIFFPTIHWVSLLEVEKKEEKREEKDVVKEEEVKVGEKEEDRDNVQLRRSQSSVSCFDFLFSCHHSVLQLRPSTVLVWASCEWACGRWPVRWVLCIVCTLQCSVSCAYDVVGPSYLRVLCCTGS